MKVQFHARYYRTPELPKGYSTTPSVCKVREEEEEEETPIVKVIPFHLLVNQTQIHIQEAKATHIIIDEIMIAFCGNSKISTTTTKKLCSPLQIKEKSK